MEQLVTLQHGQVNYTGPETLIQFRVKSVEAGRTGTGFLMVDIVLQRMFYYHHVRTLSMHRIAVLKRVMQIPVRKIKPWQEDVSYCYGFESWCQQISFLMQS